MGTTRLSDAGYGIGLRMLELLSFREKQSKKEKSLKHVLQFIRQTVWKTLFGKIADDLLKSKDKDDECEFLFPHWLLLKSRVKGGRD